MSSVIHVLSVDDEPGILKTRQMLLEYEGYEVHSAVDGEKALELFAANPIDLVLLDYFMPGIDGGKVALEMKRLRPEIPIIMVSASPMAITVKACVDCIVPKGEGPLVLFKRMKEMLERDEALPI